MELKQNHMKKGPFKLKYTSSAFPFKASPAKFLGGTGFMGSKGPEETKIRNDHRHTQDFIAEEGERNDIQVHGQTINLK